MPATSKRLLVENTGSYLSFDGSTTKVVANNSGSGSIFDLSGAVSFTWTFWVYFNSRTTVNMCVNRGNTTTTGYDIFLNSDGLIYAGVRGGSFCNSDAKVETGQWYHIAFVANSPGNVTTLYQNLVAQAVTGTHPGAVTNALSLHFGRNSSAVAQFLNGNMQEVRFYSGTALSVAQLQSDYSGTQPITPTEYWKLNDGSGSTAVASVSTTYNGVITGATWNTANQRKNTRTLI